MRVKWTILVAAVWLCGCADDAYEVLVDLRTDLVPGVEVGRVQTVLEDPPQLEETVAVRGDDWLAGERVASFAEVPSGTRVLVIRALDHMRDVVLERVARIEVKSNVGITILATRNCRGVTCPGAGDDPAATTCLGGRCIDPSCVEGVGEACRAPECAVDSECAPPVAACGSARCATGVCVYRGDDTMCAASEYCAPDLGCVELPDIPDAGPADGGPGATDAGPGTMDAGPSTMDAGPLPSGIVSLETGGYHSCVLLASGELLCWGKNVYGQLGNGAMGPTAPPARVSAVSNATHVSLGREHTCAVRSARAWCWGRNEYGQLGDGTIIDQSSPVQVSGLGTIARLAPGKWHTCAQDPAGTVSCWGRNNQGNLGDGTLVDRRSPAPVVGLSGAREIDSSSNFTCVLVGGGGRCWGEGVNYHRGDGSNLDSPDVTTVTGVTMGMQLSVGSIGGCVLLSGGTGRCWGRNSFGQVGDGTRTERRTPSPAPGLDRAVQVGSGGRHTCARYGDGSVSCWGGNDHGETGAPVSMIRVLSPRGVAGVPAAVQLAVGYRHSCVRAADDRVSCWGRNLEGQLADGTVTDNPSPTEIALPIP